MQVFRGGFILYFKTIASISCYSFFFKEYFNPQVRINKMVNKHTVDYYTSLSELTSRIHPLTFLWTPKGFIAPEYFLNFSSNLDIPPWLQKSFKFIVLRLLENIYESKNWFYSFLLMPPNKTLFHVLIITPKAEGNYPFFQTAFFKYVFFPSRKAGELWSCKNDQN